MLRSDDDHALMEPAEAKRLCSQFSRFFIDKLQRIAREIKTRLSAVAFSVQTLRRAPSSQTLNEFAAVTEEDVARLIKLLPPKTPPLDCLQVSLLKTAVAVMAPSLIRLANLSFAAGVFPSRYKLGHVIPLLKKPGMPKRIHLAIDQLPIFALSPKFLQN